MPVSLFSTSSVVGDMDLIVLQLRVKTQSHSTGQKTILNIVHNILHSHPTVRSSAAIRSEVSMCTTCVCREKSSDEV